MWIKTNERKDASPLLGFVPLFTSMARHMDKYLASDIKPEFLVEFCNRHVRMADRLADLESIGNLTVSRLEAPEFADWVVDGLERETKNLNRLGSTLRSADLTKLSNIELAAEITHTVEALNQFIIYNNFVNASDFYHDILTSRILEFLRVALQPSAHITAEAAYSALTSPSKAVWVQEEEEDLLRLLIFIQDSPQLADAVRSDGSWSTICELHSDIQTALEAHAEKYFWIRYEQEGDTLCAQHFYDSLVRMLAEGVDGKSALDGLEKRRARVSSQFDDANSAVRLSIGEQHLLNVARRFVYWKLHLREVKVRLYCCADPLLIESSRRLGLNRHQVRHLTVEELVQGLQNVVELDVACLDERIEYCVFHFTSTETRVLVGQQARDAFSVVKEEMVPADLVEVKGTCAYPGVARGLVKQVVRVEDADAFQRGNILVAYMTDVGIISAMKKASAIITDVGGVTCHASIIAREFGIPCVIGTKIGMKALLDGYLVEVDAEVGVVTILAKASNTDLGGQTQPQDDSEVDIVQTLELQKPRVSISQMRHVRPLKHLGADDVDVAGGKGANIGELAKCGIRFPPGFVILTSAFDEFAFSSDLGPRVNSLLRGIRDCRSLRCNSQIIQRLIVEAEMPPELQDQIQIEFDAMACNYAAVRSSATLEDSCTASWAGQLESYLNTTTQDLLLNVRKCWASLFSDRAMSYRLDRGYTAGAPSMGVLIQQMVDSRISGTAFSAHPVSGDSRCVFIESVVGLGETLVLGRETPCSYTLEKNTLNMFSRSLHKQRFGLRRSAQGGNESFPVLELAGRLNHLSDEEARELASVVIELETKFGLPVDVEWALNRNELYILQCRPVTA